MENEKNACCETDIAKVEALPTCQAMITSAINAYHALATGTKEVEVFFRDQKVRYTESNMPMLLDYIKNLHSTCGNDLSAAILGLNNTRRGLRYFGGKPNRNRGCC